MAGGRGVSTSNPAGSINNGIQIFNPTTGQFQTVVLQKGEILTFDDNLGEYVAFQPSVTNDDILTAQSAQDTGLLWEDPADLGAGALTLLRTHSFSGVTFVDFTSDMSSSHDDYMIIYNIRPSDMTQFNLRISTDNGSTFLDAGYSSRMIYISHVGAPTKAVSNHFTTFHRLAGVNLTDDRISNMTSEFSIGQIHLFSVNDTKDKNILSQSYFLSDRTAVNPDIRFGVPVSASAVHSTTSAVNAFRIYPQSGEIEGSISLYGYTK